jgi:hypothetical protein
MKFKKFRKLNFGKSITNVEVIVKNTLTNEETKEHFDSMKEVPKKYNNLKIGEVNQIKFGLSITLKDSDLTVNNEDFEGEDD